MGLFSKKHKLSANEAGKALIPYLDPSTSKDEVYATAEKQLKMIKEPDSKDISFELYCLKIFAVDFMTNEVFGDKDKKILDSFHKGIDTLWHQKDPEMSLEIEKRLTGYSAEVATCCGETPVKEVDKAELAHIIGEAFSNFLVRKTDGAITKIAGTYFTGCCGTIEDMLRSFKITW